MSLFWSAGSQKPTARSAELIVEELGDELLVYDQRNDQVHCLSSAAGKVWSACDGQTSVEQLARSLEMDSEFLNRALGELEACGLLEGEPFGGMTRREATTRFAQIGAAAAAAPLIASVVAPTPALALTRCGTGSLGCQGFFVTNDKSHCPAGTRCTTQNNCACCMTTVKCHLNGTGSTGAYVTCVDAGCTSCTSNAAGAATIITSCTAAGYNVVADCTSGNLNTAHCNKTRR